MKTFLDKIEEVQNILKQLHWDGWLLYDFHRSNSLALSFLEIPSQTMLSRRFFYWIPQNGEPIKIVSQIESHVLNHLPGKLKTYASWQELEQHLKDFQLQNKKIAMEYSPNNAIPVVSKVDGGTIDQIRQLGAEVVSSAHLIQHYTSVWTSSQLQSHLKAAHALDQIAAETWKYIKFKLQSNQSISEYDVQQFMLKCMDNYDCLTEDPPICAVNQNSANPHYAPTKEIFSKIHGGDFILIDLWCKQKHPEAVYADIARVGVAASQATKQQQDIFNIVKEARDIATTFIQENYSKQHPIQGWQVDQICRDFIKQKGYGEYFIHRTGHNIGQSVHGSGTNLDNLETHDERELIAGTCFSVEPGIYLPHQFGVRLEYNIYLDLQGKIQVTGGIQKNICLI